MIISQNVLTNSVSAFLDPEFVVTKLDGSKKFPTGKEPFAPDEDPGKLKQLNEKLNTRHAQTIYHTVLNPQAPRLHVQ